MSMRHINAFHFYIDKAIIQLTVTVYNIVCFDTQSPHSTLHPKKDTNVLSAFTAGLRVTITTEQHDNELTERRKLN